MPESPRHPDLWQILYSGENCSSDTQNICPYGKMVWISHDQGRTDDNGYQAMKEAKECNCDCCLPCMLFFGFVNGKRRSSWEENKE